MHCNNPALKQEPATSTTSLANVRPAERLDVQRAFSWGCFEGLQYTPSEGVTRRVCVGSGQPEAGPGARRAALTPTDRRSIGGPSPATQNILSLRKVFSLGRPHPGNRQLARTRSTDLQTDNLAYDPRRRLIVTPSATGRFPREARAALS